MMSMDSGRQEQVSVAVPERRDCYRGAPQVAGKPVRTLPSEQGLKPYTGTSPNGGPGTGQNVIVQTELEFSPV